MISSKKISELKIGDTVIGTSGPVKIINIIPEYIPNRMFLIKFSVGKVKCSDTHLWSVYIGNKNFILETKEIFSSSKKKDMKFGHKNGPNIISIKEIKPEKVCCIDIESDDKLFALDLEKGTVFTHNCQFRAACGRLGSIASMMLFGNTMATTIDGSHPGAGMISANGSISSIQYYYENIDWIQNFYKKCGYDETGHRKPIPKRSETNMKDLPEEIRNLEDIEDQSIDFSDINFGEDEEIKQNFSKENPNGNVNKVLTEDEEYLQDLDNIFDFTHDIAKIEIEGITGEVDKTKRQKFES